MHIIYKTAKPSHLKKTQMIEKINNPLFQVILISTDWILIKQIGGKGYGGGTWEKRLDSMHLCIL